MEPIKPITFGNELRTYDMIPKEHPQAVFLWQAINGMKKDERYQPAAETHKKAVRVRERERERE